MEIDNRITLGNRRHFAGEITQLSSATVEFLQSQLSGSEPEEFYAGLLAGLATATTLLQVGAGGLIPPVTCIVADFCERGELSV